MQAITKDDLRRNQISVFCFIFKPTRRNLSKYQRINLQVFVCLFVYTDVTILSIKCCVLIQPQLQSQQSAQVVGISNVPWTLTVIHLTDNILSSFVTTLLLTSQTGVYYTNCQIQCSPDSLFLKSFRILLFIIRSEIIWTVGYWYSCV